MGTIWALFAHCAFLNLELRLQSLEVSLKVLLNLGGIIVDLLTDPLTDFFSTVCCKSCTLVAHWTFFREIVSLIWTCVGVVPPLRLRVAVSKPEIQIEIY